MNETSTTGDRVLDALSGVPLCAHLDERSRRKLARLCTLKSFDAGDLLFEEGSMGLGLFIVTSGKVEVYKKSGKKKVGLGSVDAGGVLGQIALLDDQPRAASAAALEPTECLLLTRDSFETLVKKDPQIAWCLTPGLAERVRELQKLAMEAQLERDKADRKAPKAEKEKAAAKAKADEAEGAEDEDEEEDDDEPSELESALLKMMRMQYGIMAGTARGVTDMAKVMETFLDSMAEETDFKHREDWSDLLDKIPDAMVTAARNALDEGEKVPGEMVDVYRRYSDGKK